MLIFIIILELIHYREYFKELFPVLNRVNFNWNSVNVYSNLSQHSQFLLSYSFFVFLFELSTDFSIPLINSLLSIFQVSMSLLNVLKGLEDRISHLLGLLLHFFEQLWVEKLDCWNTIWFLGLRWINGSGVVSDSPRFTEIGTILSTAVEKSCVASASS